MDYSYLDLFRYFRPYFRGYWARIISGTILRAISAVMWLYSAYALAKVITFLTNYKQGDGLNEFYLIFISWYVVAQLRFIFIYYAKKLCIIVGEKIAYAIDLDAIKHLSRLDISWHEKEGSGNKVKKIQKGASGISTLIRIWIINVIDIIVGTMGMIYIISHFNKTLIIFVFIYLVIYFSVATTFRKKTVQASKEKNIEDEKSTGLMFEIVNNIRTVKVMGMSEAIFPQLKSTHEIVIEKIKKNQFWYHSQIFARATWETLARNLLLFYVGYGVIQGHYELGFFVLFAGYFTNFSSSMNDLAVAAQDISIERADAGRLIDILKEPIKISIENGKSNFPKEWNNIHIKNLSFAYGENKVLSNVDLNIKKGEKVGIVGLSGAGKSTLFKLLLKEYETSDGDIFIGDTSLKNIKSSDYVKHVAVVLQETEVFNMTLKKNIQLANIDRENDNELFLKAINTAHVSDFVSRLKDGENTMIGEKGVKLSGGEKQRLGIARAVFKSPEILFLDEATSHLDVESEQKIQDSLAHFFKDVTAVVIAHRLSTIKEMDRIVVIEQGKIIEMGKFDELHAKDGRFREFWDKQSM